MQYPPMLIVTSRLADDALWSEVINLGAYNDGEFDTALDIYDHLATGFAKAPPEASAELTKRYLQHRLEALAGIIRCHAASKRGEQVRTLPGFAVSAMTTAV